MSVITLKPLFKIGFNPRHNNTKAEGSTARRPLPKKHILYTLVCKCIEKRTFEHITNIYLYIWCIYCIEAQSFVSHTNGEIQYSGRKMGRVCADLKCTHIWRSSSSSCVPRITWSVCNMHTLLCETIWGAFYLEYVKSWLALTGTVNVIAIWRIGIVTAALLAYDTALLLMRFDICLR